MQHDRTFPVWSSRIEQEDFPKKEKDPWGHFGELSCSSISSLLSNPLPSTPVGLWEISSPNTKHQEKSAHSRPQAPTRSMQFRETGDQRHQGKWESRKTLSRTSIAGRRVSAWTCGSGGHWRAGPEASGVLVRMGKSWARLPELATPKKDQQNWLSQQACFFGFVLFLSNYLLLFFLSSNTFFLSFLLSCSTPCFSPFMSLLPSIFFSFFNPHKWDNKT